MMQVMVKRELEDEHVKWENLYRDCKFFDDVNGHKELDWSSVVEARKLEMAFFKKMGVCSKVGRSEVKAKGGRVLSTRWVDTNKGDDKSPNYRSRLVGREVRIDSIDLFAPTPPLEAMKFLISVCARGQNRSQNRRLRMMTIDARRACFYAPAQREVYIEIPMEDRESGDEGMVGKLNLSLYGTRDAALNWTRHRHATSDMSRGT